ncbi:hypothetical protein FISHEDRAFT_69152 [Fistulina hepatica ATCC 64428]|uniref:Uncharacterized protein n=1 Tax=Fistulina hepatica ATCC 64428 TaxID=1128425 RepID=A0A0D7APR7_9AGAR|nr:hypothetical protein FISHEDRAFT_69152 [Fistulina hepatica ATCC 64428]
MSNSASDSSFHYTAMDFQLAGNPSLQQGPLPTNLLDDLAHARHSFNGTPVRPLSGLTVPMGQGDRTVLSQQLPRSSPPNMAVSATRRTATLGAAIDSSSLSAVFFERLQHDFKLGTKQMLVLKQMEAEQEATAGRSQAADVQEVLQDFKNMLNECFKLTGEQKNNIRRLTGDFLYDVGRYKFMNVQTDVFLEVEKYPGRYNMSNVFVGNNHREGVVRTFCKEAGTSERSKLQKDLVASVTSRPTALDQFTYDSAMKYKYGGLGAGQNAEILAHNVLLRAATLHINHSGGLGDIEEDEDGADGADGSSTDGQPKTKKRKTRGGRTLKGFSFWEKVDAWFATEIVSLGSYDLEAPKWKQRVQELIAADKHLFGGMSGFLAEGSVEGTPDREGSMDYEQEGDGSEHSDSIPALADLLSF